MLWVYSRVAAGSSPTPSSFAPTTGQKGDETILGSQNDRLNAYKMVSVHYEGSKGKIVEVVATPVRVFYGNNVANPRPQWFFEFRDERGRRLVIPCLAIKSMDAISVSTET